MSMSNGAEFNVHVAAAVFASYSYLNGFWIHPRLCYIALYKRRDEVALPGFPDIIPGKSFR